MRVKIYGLVDPRTNELRYIGRTSQTLQARLATHFSTRNKGNDWRGHWIAKLHSEGCRPEIFEIETVEESQWKEAEQFWIAYFRFIGCRLTNSTVGGEGFNGAAHSEETKRKISVAKLGKSITFSNAEERSRKISCSRTGYAMPDKTKLLLSQAQKGKSHLSEQTKSKIKFLARLGLTRVAIAAQTGVHRQTVGFYLLERTR